MAFYVGKLGFEVQVDAPMPNGGRWVMLALPSATTAVALVKRTTTLRRESRRGPGSR